MRRILRVALLGWTIPVVYLTQWPILWLILGKDEANGYAREAVGLVWYGE